MEMVHADHANGGGWRLGGRKEGLSMQKGQSEQRPGDQTQHDV